MQVRWEHLVPAEFKKLAKEEKVCVLPIGSLERHGEHMPYGTDAIVAHEAVCRAAQMEPCVVFPPYWFGQVHEASCFSGTINFPVDFLVKMLELLLDQIAQNGFEKILIVNGHGGNSDFLQYFVRSMEDRDIDYSIYNVFLLAGNNFKTLDVWERPGGGHADESETSMIMAAAPGTVKMELLDEKKEPILPCKDLDGLRAKNVFVGYDWHAMYPENVTGSPSFATMEKGEVALDAVAKDIAAVIRAVKEDTVVPRLRKEHLEDIRKIKKSEGL